MKVRSTLRFPLGENEYISKKAAESLLGQEFDTKMENDAVGKGKVVEVDYVDSKTVWITVMMDVDIGPIPFQRPEHLSRSNIIEGFKFVKRDNNEGTV